MEQRMRAGDDWDDGVAPSRGHRHAEPGNIMLEGDGAPALADVAFTCIAARLPFRGDAACQIAHAHRAWMPLEDEALRPELGRSLAVMVSHALAKAPAMPRRAALAYANLLQVSAR